MSIHTRVVSLLPYALFIHIVMAVWFYGTPEIFPVTTVDSNETKTSSNVEIYDRFLSKNCFLFTLFLVLAIVYYLLQGTVLRVLCRCCCKGHIDTMFMIPSETFTSVKDHIERSGISTYDPGKNAKYAEILHAIEDAAQVNIKAGMDTERKLMTEGTIIPGIVSPGQVVPMAYQPVAVVTQPNMPVGFPPQLHPN